MIEVRPVPVCISDFLIGAGPDEKLPPALRVRGEWAPELVMIKGETALEAARNVRNLLLPRPPFAQRTDEWQMIFFGDFFQQQIGQRRGGFADGKTGMPAALDKCG